MATIDTRDQTVTEKVAEFSEVGLFLLDATSPFDSTLDAAAAAAQKTVPVDATTNAAVDDYAMIHEGNELEIIDVETINAAVDVVAKSNLWKLHASGQVIKGLVKVILGEVMEDGFQDELSIVMNLHNVGTRHGAWDSTPGHHEQALSFQIVHATIDNIQLALGLADSATGGTGSDADPWYVDSDPEQFAKGLQQSSLCHQGRIPGVYVLGEYLNTGEIFEIQYWSCALGGGDFGFPLKVDDLSPVQFRFNWFANRRFLRYAGGG